MDCGCVNLSEMDTVIRDSLITNSAQGRERRQETHEGQSLFLSTFCFIYHPISTILNR